MNAAQSTHTQTTGKGRPLNNQEFERALKHDTLVVFALGGVIACAMIAGFFFLLDHLVHSS